MNRLASSRTRGRVACVHRNRYDVVIDGALVRADLPGSFLHECTAPSELPAVGDWVLLERSADHARIHSVEPRTTLLARKGAGSEGATQVLAANVELALITSLNKDLSAARLDRYLALARDSLVLPVIVLTKADLSGPPPDLTHLSARVVVTSAVLGTGLDELRRAEWKAKRRERAIVKKGRPRHGGHGGGTEDTEGSS